MGKNITITVLGLCISLLCHAQQDKAFIQRLEAEIQEKIANKEIPSIAFSVSQRGQILYQNAYGWADMAAKLPATIHTSYQIASVSKPLTATGIMILNQLDQLDIDASASQYMGDLAFKQTGNSSDQPTIRHLLNHTSGLGTYFDIYYMDEALKPVHFQTAFEEFGSLHHPPGVISEYSNLGYGLLDHIISQTSGKSFGQFMQEALFAPLSMQHTYVQGSTPTGIEIQAATKYSAELVALLTVINNTYGAGNIYASAPDLVTFGNFYLQGKKGKESILSSESFTEMWDYRAPDALFHYHSDAYYGLGWYVKPDDHGYQVVWHEGGMMGASSTLKIIPSEEIVIAVVTNVSNRGFCNYVVDELSKNILPAYDPTPLNESTEVSDYESFLVDSSYLGKWSGTLSVDELAIPFSLTFQADGSATVQYIDYTYSSYLTDGNPLPNEEKLLMALTNQGSFIGLFLGELPSQKLRSEWSHLLSLKLLKEGDKLRGTVVALAAAEREYNAYPFHVELTKE